PALPRQTGARAWRRRRTARAGARCASSRRAGRAWPRTGIRAANACSSSEPIKAVTLRAIAGPADVGELDPAGARPVELVLRAALHQQQRTGVRPHDVEGLAADAAMVVECR